MHTHVSSWEDRLTSITRSLGITLRSQILRPLVLANSLLLMSSLSSDDPMVGPMGFLSEPPGASCSPFCSLPSLQKALG